MSVEQFEILKNRAIARRGISGSVSTVLKAVHNDLALIQLRLHSLPVDEAMAGLEKLNLTETQRAAFRVLLK